MNSRLPQRKSIRLRNYNYSLPGWYYITICTQNRRCLFSQIVDGEMTLNDAGKMVNKWWLKIPERFKNVQLDEYQIMPNHLHGIVVITDNNVDNNVGAGSPRPLSGNHRSGDHGSGNPTPTGLGQIIAYFKYQSTKYINASNETSGKRLWQRNYYENIIRNNKSLNRIRHYIKINPKMWDRDRNNPKNL